MSKERGFCFSLMIVLIFLLVGNFVHVPSVDAINTRTANKASLVSEVLKLVPREPRIAKKDPSRAKDFRRGMVIIAENKLGSEKPIQQLLLHWAKRTDFAHENLGGNYKVYENAVFTMPDDQIVKIFCRYLLLRFGPAAEKLVENKVDVEKIIKESLRTLRLSKLQILNAEKNKTKPHNEKSVKIEGKEVELPSFYILVGYGKFLKNFRERKTTKYRMVTKSVKKTIINQISKPEYERVYSNINSKDKVAGFFWPAGNSETSGELSTVELLIDVINSLRWKERTEFLKELSQGELDSDINKFTFFKQEHLELVKQKARDTLEKLKNL